MKVGQLKFRPDTHYWYCRVDGHQRIIGKKGCSEADARVLHAKLVVEADQVNSEGTGSLACRPFSDLYAMYEESQLRPLEHKPRCRKETYFTPFVARFGTTKCKDIKAHMIQDWLATMGTWNNNTKGGACKQLSCLWRWATDRELVPTNPMAAVRRPKETARGEDMVISADTYKALLEHARPYMGRILRALWGTGARPSEVLGATAREFRPETRSIVKEKHKGAHKGVHREILLADDVLAMVHEAVAQRPDGPIWPGANGGIIKAGDFLSRLKKLAKRANVTAKVLPYSFRHTYACRLLESGVPDTVVAGLMGHTSTKPLFRHYAHLLARLRQLSPYLARVQEAMRV